jgi:hypothetical protein
MPFLKNNAYLCRQDETEAQFYLAFDGTICCMPDSLAELASQEEALISSAYTRAYKTMKAKVENAQELLQSCKKVLSRRIMEQELTKISNYN